MSAFLRLMRWEVRHLLRSSASAWVCGSLVLAGLFATWSGGQRLERHRAAVASLEGHYATQMETIARKFTPDGHAGYVAYYTFVPTHHPLPTLGALATGVRDLVPDVLWVRMLGLEGQIHETDLGNPALQALGGFDLAFVWCALAPLGLLVLAHDALTRDRDAGRLALVVAQAGSAARLLAARVGVRVLALGLTATFSVALAAVWLGVPADAALARWLGAVWAHLACWGGLAALIAVATRSAAASLAVALSAWIATVVLVPALLNLAVATAYPVSEGIELTVRQRQEVHGAWDRPRAEVMEAFFAHRPEWRDSPPVTGRFAWRWYYAMQELGDRAVAADSARWRSHLLARQAWMTRLAWLSPPAYTQRLLAARAGTDLEAHLVWLDHVRAFHEELRAHFLPLCFADAHITPADYAAFPRYSALTPAPDRGPTSLPLWLVGSLGAVAAGRLAHRMQPVIRSP